MLSELGHSVCTDSCHAIDRVTSGSLMPSPVRLPLAEKRTLEVEF